MYDLHVSRLVKAYPHAFTEQQAADVVARAYGYYKLDLSTYEFSDKYQGLQYVRPYGEMLKADPTHQTMDMMHMALNLALSFKDDVRRGVPERDLVATMIGFSNFDALINYARSEPIDPNSTDPVMLEKFRVRYGYYAPIQYVLGRYIHEHTLIIQPDEELAQRFIDQELMLNPMQNTKVVVVRDKRHGADLLEATKTRIGIAKGAIDDGYAARVREAISGFDAVISIVPKQGYKLTDLVREHLPVLLVDSKDGRALIVDVEGLNLDPAELDAAYALASDNKLHLTVIVKEPNAALWQRSGIRMIFNFDRSLAETLPDMDKFLLYASQYVGFKRGKMQFMYHSERSGPRFGAMDLIPDDPQVKTMLQRMKEMLIG